MSQDPAPLDTPPAPTSAPPRAGTRALVFTGIGVVAAIAAVVGLVVLLKGTGDTAAAPATSAAPTTSAAPESFELRGTMTLEEGATSVTRGGAECAGKGGYDDIAEGAQVTVYDAAGKAVALGALAHSDDWGGGKCSFTFAVPDVPGGERIYQVEVTHRGKVSFDEGRARSGSVALTLG